MITVFVLFSSTKYILACTIVGSNAAVGTLYLTNDFLRPISNFKYSVAGSTDMGKFWYLANVKKMHYSPDFIEYPQVSYPTDLKNLSQDRYFAGKIFKTCYHYRNTIGLIYNRVLINQLKEWCTLENDFLTEDMLEILRWEMNKKCRVVWKANANNLSDSGFFPFILQRIHKEQDLETLEKFKKFPKFWKEKMVKWVDEKKHTIDTTPAGECPLTHNFLPYTWEDSTKEGKFDEDASKIKDFTQSEKSDKGISHPQDGGLKS